MSSNPIFKSFAEYLAKKDVNMMSEIEKICFQETIKALKENESLTSLQHMLIEKLETWAQTKIQQL